MLVVNTLNILKDLSQDEMMLFQIEYNNQKKSGSIAMLLSLLLGSIGMNFFYLDEWFLGILCVLFCWTGIPFVIGVINSFFQFSKVKRYNYKLMNKIVSQIIKSRLTPQPISKAV